MVQSVEAVFEDGVLKPLAVLEGLTEHTRVTVTVTPAAGGRDPLDDYIGILSDEEAAEMLKIIEAEFGRVEPESWR